MAPTNCTYRRRRNRPGDVSHAGHDGDYTGAFVFGSVARGETHDQSDFDAKVVVDRDNPCGNINHPFVGGVKLDITFSSLEQLREATEREIAAGSRVPIVAESTIVFDKTGELGALRERARVAGPEPVTPADHQLLQFLLYHSNEKIERYLERDPPTALLGLHMNLGDALTIHYRLRGKWRVSSKRLLADLRAWDPALAELVGAFVSTIELGEKFALWSRIVDHVLAPLGGRQPIAENTCACATCARDLATLLAEEQQHF